MLKSLEKRKELLGIIEKITREKGYFDVYDLSVATGMPRSTIQDWVHRFVDDGCVTVLEECAGRRRAKYAMRRTRSLPASACKRIFTTVDGDIVEIFHECRSEGCIAFCEYMYAMGNPHVRKNGLILRQKVKAGPVAPRHDEALYLEKVLVSNGLVYQHIRTFGGPAYSLTEMMESADGVLDIMYNKRGCYVEGVVVTEALTHMAIAVDDTDEAESGATFALTLSLLDLLSSIEGVRRISHNVGFLYPGVPGKTAGNAVSYIELAVKKEVVESLIQRAVEYLKGQTLSKNTGMAVKVGLKPCPELVGFAARARRGIVTAEEALAVARRSRVRTFKISGERGIIGAVAALGMIDCPPEDLMDVTRAIT
ncbi:protein of unknown function (DUF1743) [Methanocella conradii HZ254]|uniref:tRNA(Ile2) 2-agmatinylcytidine synthetase n=1 Tax=Methanocella conradii (strain DSM 24694 / JCM 17849 / CGMCC 1.5162 / HZ254) TaxID=1041930 RepID=H8I9H0_METCZ|nr:hypothetical protein [Methanocella conradii]AFD00015.1 protein of unknown function (DUF1743) [Methanocella conradii HZ254]MDI6897361.1 hypothetical protein [Methanocella conradii]